MSKGSLYRRCKSGETATWWICIHTIGVRNPDIDSVHLTVNYHKDGTSSRQPAHFRVAILQGFQEQIVGDESQMHKHEEILVMVLSYRGVRIISLCISNMSFIALGRPPAISWTEWVTSMVTSCAQQCRACVFWVKMRIANVTIHTASYWTTITNHYGVS